MTVTYNNPKAIAPPDGDFSQTTIAATPQRVIFISGQVPRDRLGNTVGRGDMAAQAIQVFQNLQDCLFEHDCDFHDVAKATIFTTDISRVDEIMKVRSQFYGDAKPASTLVGVTALGDSDWMLEIEMIVITCKSRKNPGQI